ncbi:MAG: RIP metalloprotease RseP [Prevotellaceae bacterium]|jgi:regulator of sigma E protease|nr:RIP metalloprotease RseP [Prevotellaceae bacterium]
MDILIKILQLILSLSILVIVHEFGHFFFARLFKMRVDKFYLFANPYISIVRFKKINGKLRAKWFSRNDKNIRNKLDEQGVQILDRKGRPEIELVPLAELPDNNWHKYPETTEWGIGWLPIGGYCKISGMIDESMDVAQMKQAAQPWEFRSKPAWQRLLVMIGGVLFNVILAILIYWGMLFTWGESYLANRDVKNGVGCSPLAHEIGFRNGDKIMSLDGDTVENFGDIQIKIIRDRIKNVVVERNGEKATVQIADTCISAILKDREFLNPRMKSVISLVQEESMAKKYGIRVNDRIIAVNSQSTEYYDELASSLSKNKSTTVDVKVIRSGDTLIIPVEVSEFGQIGIGISDSSLKPTYVSYGFFEALPAGISKGINGIKDYVKDLGLIFSPKTKAYESVGSFIAIGNIFPSLWIWEKFWKLTALLSIMLAVINILPIPALDGGHAVFAIYEIIFRRKPSDRFLERAQMVGLLIILGLMLFALSNDIVNFVIK